MNKKEIEESKVYENMDDVKKDSVYYIEFKKSYEFEGEPYNHIDISKIEDISAKDLLETDKLYTKMGYISPTAEMSLAYALIIASKVTNKPLEFFSSLPGNEAMKVKNAVVNFLYN